MEGSVRGKQPSQPFYATHPRLQTSCEIIREARAGVMGVREGAAAGLRAVPTSRPFTPKERERVLFGDTNRKARPPSAVNLSYLKKSEGIVKLPAIPVASRTRAVTSRQFPRSGLSLDNLIEELEIDQGIRRTKTFDQDELPGFRKSYSSPQEREVYTPPSPDQHLLRNQWTSESSLDTVPVRKKSHRLQKLSAAESVEALPEQNTEEYPTIPESTAPPNALKDSLVKAEETIDEKKVAVEEVDENVVEPSDDQIAVLSNGKLVWETPTPPKDTAPPVVAVESQPKPSRKEETMAHVHSLIYNKNKVNNRIKVLDEELDDETSPTKKSSKMADFSNRTFHMNNNTRHHVSSKTVGQKTYKKFTERRHEEVEEEKEVKNVRQNSAGWDFFWKNSYFRAKEEVIRPEFEPVLEILEELRTMHGQNGPDWEQEIECRIGKIYFLLKEADGFCHGGMPSSLTSKLLQTLYMFADTDRPRLLLLISRLLLAVRLDTALAAGCKMVFKVARSDTNDQLFIAIPDILELFVDGIGRASPLDAAESCIYGYGALKFLTANSVLLAHALHYGALDLVTLHLKMVNQAQEDTAKVGDQTQAALFQLTAALRNIADGEGIGPIFFTTNCVPTLAKTLLLFQADEEIVCTIARTLSSLSGEEDLVQALLTVDGIAVTLVSLLDKYQHNQQILVRLCYTLGNVLAHSDVARIQLSRSDNCLPTLLNVLQLCVGKKSADAEEQETCNDAIVKVIRVLANMAMNPIVGNLLSTPGGHGTQLATLLKSLVSGTPSAVMLAALGCLNNLSYYGQAHTCLLELTKEVLSILDSKANRPTVDCCIEACRVLGNLTRHKRSLELLFTEGGLKILEKILSRNWDGGYIARAACGVLVNMLLDQPTRNTFLEHQGIDKLVTVLERYPGDWLLASLVCQAIWNACVPDIDQAVAHNNLDQLLTTLANGLEEDNTVEGDYEWEDFAVIATDLLERFNAHIETR